MTDHEPAVTVSVGRTQRRIQTNVRPNLLSAPPRLSLRPSADRRTAARKSAHKITILCACCKPQN